MHIEAQAPCIAKVQGPPFFFLFAAMDRKRNRQPEAEAQYPNSRQWLDQTRTRFETFDCMLCSESLDQSEAIWASTCHWCNKRICWLCTATTRREVTCRFCMSEWIATDAFIEDDLSMRLSRLSLEPSDQTVGHAAPR